MVQWLRLCSPNAGDTGSIPGWGTKIPHLMEQLSPPATRTEAISSRSLCAATREASTLQQEAQAPRLEKA